MTKKTKARKENNPIKPKNIYVLLMKDGPKNEEKERETLSIKEAQKEIEKPERANKNIKEGIQRVYLRLENYTPQLIKMKKSQ